MGLLSKVARNAPQGSAQRTAEHDRSIDLQTGPLEPAKPRFGLLARSLRARTSEPRRDGGGTRSAPGPAALSTREAGTGSRPAASAAPRASQPPAHPTVTPDQLAVEVEAAFRNLPADVELPSRMFSVLKGALGVRKGALLLYDPVRLVYAPWASCGHDQTTLHRLRIPLGANETFNALAAGKPILLEGGGPLSQFQPYFSTREFGLLVRLVLAPILADDRLAGALMLADAEAPTASDADLLACLSQISTAAAPLIQQARGRIMKGTEPRGTRAGMSPEETLSAFVTSVGGPSVTAFASLSLEDYARGVIASHPHLDPFRLQQDLAYLLGVFLSDTGMSLALRPGLYLVGLRSFPRDDLDLFAHQLTLFLKGLFGNGGPGEVRVLKSTSWPVEGMKAAGLLSLLSP